jgi:uncharacterized membrane protein
MPKTLSRIVDTLALLAFAATLAMVYNEYAELPAHIPTHFGFTGKPDRYSDKSALILLAAIGGFTLALLSAIPFFPKWINVPGPRTPGNIARSIALIRVIKLEIMAFFAYLIWGIIQIAKGAADTLGLGVVVSSSAS